MGLSRQAVKNIKFFSNVRLHFAARCDDAHDRRRMRLPNKTPHRTGRFLAEASGRLNIE
jgi:hypothetical protein